MKKDLQIIELTGKQFDNALLWAYDCGHCNLSKKHFRAYMKLKESFKDMPTKYRRKRRND